MPALFDHTNINRGRIDRVLAITDPILNEQLLPLCALIDKGKGGAIDRFLNRVSVANLTPPLVQEVLTRALAGIDALVPFLSGTTANASGRDSRSLQDRVGVLLEIASRLVIRLNPVEAAGVLARGLAWARDPRWQHNWTSEPLGNLLSRALEVIPPSDQIELLVDIVLHPLPGEKEFSHIADYWPEPSRDLKLPPSTSRPTRPMFAAGVENLLEKARSGSRFDRERALLRLDHLHEAGVLTVSETERLAAALWARLEPNGLPADTVFRKFAFLRLPQTSPDQAEAALRSALLPPGAEVNITEDLLDLLGSERGRREGGGAYFKLTPEEATRCLDAALRFFPKPPVQRREFFGDRDQTSSYLGAALAVGILPMLDESLIGPDRLERLLSLIKSGNTPSAVQAWPQVVRLEPRHEEDATTAVVQALLSSEIERVQPGLWAVERWRVMARAGGLEPLPHVFY